MGNEHGLSLLEVIIATAISVILVALTTDTALMLSTQEKKFANLENARGTRALLGRIVQDAFLRVRTEEYFNPRTLREAPGHQYSWGANSAFNPIATLLLDSVPVPIANESHIKTFMRMKNSDAGPSVVIKQTMSSMLVARCIPNVGKDSFTQGKNIEVAVRDILNSPRIPLIVESKNASDVPILELNCCSFNTSGARGRGVTNCQTIANGGWLPRIFVISVRPANDPAVIDGYKVVSVDEYPTAGDLETLFGAALYSSFDANLNSTSYTTHLVLLENRCQTNLTQQRCSSILPSNKLENETQYLNSLSNLRMTHLTWQGNATGGLADSGIIRLGK